MIVLGLKVSLLRLTEIPFALLRAIPPTAIFPIFILLFGIGNLSKIMAAGLSSSLIVMFATTQAVQSLPTQVVWLSQLNSAKTNMLRKVYLLYWPWLKDGLMSGVKIAANINLMFIIVTEMFVGSQEGLGNFIYDRQVSYQIPEMFLGILAVALTGLALQWLLAWLEKARLFV